MPPSEGERLIAFEAAIQELANIQAVAARYRDLERQAGALLGELQDLGRTLRQANRRGIFGDDVVEEAVSRIRRLRQEWHGHLAALRASDLYRGALEAYAADDQRRLGELLPALFAGLRREDAPLPFYRPIALTTHRRAAGSPFRTADAVAEDLDRLRHEGLEPRAVGRDWWDLDLPALSLAGELGDVDSTAALAIESVPPATAIFREGESVVIFTPRLRAGVSVVLADSSDDAWYEAAEGSYEEYRDALARELRRRGIDLRLAPAW